MQYLLLPLLLFSFLTGFTQTTWSPWEKIYSDTYITVELSFKIYSGSCETVKQNKFRYNVTGDLRASDYFLIWKMDYIDCNGSLVYQQNSLNIGAGGSSSTGGIIVESIDDKFICRSLETKFYDIDASYSEQRGTGVKAIPFSKDPKSISGKSKIYRGESTTLTVNGGALGIDAVWVWYKDQCAGQSIGIGDDITINPLDTTTYFVRAEGKNNITNCAQVTVHVNQLSSSPKEIGGKTEICKGEKTSLNVIGGTLGLNAQWVWYTIDCGGKEMGRGSTLSVSPDFATTYYVRAEGKLNKTACASVQVSVYEKSLDPASISGSQTICEGNKITLSVVGGKLAPEAKWNWYSGSCGGTSVGSGSSVQLYPSRTTNYYVRGEGECNNTYCASTTVNVDSKSSSPSYISKPYDIAKKQKITLSVSGGTLGKGAQWKWYEGSCASKKEIKEGTSIQVRVKKETEYFVRAEGSCNTTGCASVKLTTRKAHLMEPIYTSRKGDTYNNKFFHIGIGIGFDWMMFSALADRSEGITGGNPVVSGQSRLDIIGLGFKGEFVLYPYMRDHFSLGFISGGAVGTTPIFIRGGNKPTGSGEKREDYLYTRFEVGSEIAAGAKPIKALLIYKSSIQKHDFQQEVENYSYTTKYDFTRQVRKEILSGGMRLAPYLRDDKNNKRGFCFDFTYNLSRDYPWDWSKLGWSYTPLSDWNHGCGFTLWVQSVLKIQFDAILKSQLGSSSPASTKNSYYQVSFIYNRNAFL